MNVFLITYNNIYKTNRWKKPLAIYVLNHSTQEENMLIANIVNLTHVPRVVKHIY